MTAPGPADYPGDVARHHRRARSYEHFADDEPARSMIAACPAISPPAGAESTVVSPAARLTGTSTLRGLIPSTTSKAARTGSPCSWAVHRRTHHPDLDETQRGGDVEQTWSHDPTRGIASRATPAGTSMSRPTATMWPSRTSTVAPRAPPRYRVDGAAGHGQILPDRDRRGPRQQSGQDREARRACVGPLPARSSSTSLAGIGQDPELEVTPGIAVGPGAVVDHGAVDEHLVGAAVHAERIAGPDDHVARLPGLQGARPPSIPSAQAGLIVIQRSAWSRVTSMPALRPAYMARAAFWFRIWISSPLSV